jgi:MarR-like DNA-binding transcriptional regulator SgrR of sgrS sRNA
MRSVRALAVAVLSLLSVCQVASAAEPKQGGIFRMYHRDSPGSASIHEGATYSVNIPFMPVFNNLVIYNQSIAQNSMDTIVPDLADSWGWSADNKTLTFKLHHDVQWHDGKPFTSADVKCTFDMLMGKSPQKFRQNPRKSWYEQVNDVTTNGDYEVSFNLKRPQPALLALLASGYTPIYPCHVSPAEMRTHPIGSGPFKFVEFKANESIKLVRNEKYFKKGLPHLDGIEFTIITNRDPRIHLRQVRHDLPDRGVDPAAQGRQVAGPDRNMRGGTEQRLHQHHHQFIRAAVRQSRHPPRAGAGAGSQGFHLDHVRGTGRYRRHHASGSGRPVGDAEGNAGKHSGLWTGHRSQPGPSAQADGKGRLWPRQAPRRQGLDPQHSGLP